MNIISRRFACASYQTGDCWHDTFQVLTVFFSFQLGASWYISYTVRGVLLSLICIWLLSGDLAFLTHYAFDHWERDVKIFFSLYFLWPQFRWDYPLNLSISVSGGKETNKDSPSSGERTGKSPAPNLVLVIGYRGMWCLGRPCASVRFRPSPYEQGPYPQRVLGP